LPGDFIAHREVRNFFLRLLQSSSLDQPTTTYFVLRLRLPGWLTPCYPDPISQ
jgi:hypothetical protein